EATMEAMPKYSLGFLVQSVTVVLCSYLYSTTRTGQALMISILRSFVLNTIVIFAMPVLFGPESIWYAFPVFEGIAMVIAIIVTLYADRNGAIQGDNE
ncbi:MAG: MATE family efflux transporter, partial [Lachnospiraceae bacterium]|nr:MATE family efflux transporter [Candidatus Hippenecus merdae]